MVLGQRKRAVGTFSDYQSAESALQALKSSGFNMDHVSIVGRDIERQGDMAGVGAGDRITESNTRDSGDINAGDTARRGAAAGGAIGGLTGLLLGLGAISLPGVGPLLLGGALATTLGTALTGGAIGAAGGGLVGGLVGLGIPEGQAKVYGERISQGSYVVMVEGSEDDIARAESVLSSGGIQDWGIYNATDGSDGSATYPAGTLYNEGTPYGDRAPQVGSHAPTDSPAGTLYPDDPSNRESGQQL